MKIVTLLVLKGQLKAKFKEDVHPTMADLHIS